MLPRDSPSSSRSEQQAPKKRSNAPHHTDADDGNQKAEQDLSPQDRLKYLKEEIKTLSNGSLSLSIKLGKLKGEETRDLDLIRQLEAEIQHLRDQVSIDKEIVKELSEELGIQLKEKHDRVV